MACVAGKINATFSKAAGNCDIGIITPSIIEGSRINCDQSTTVRTLDETTLINIPRLACTKAVNRKKAIKPSQLTIGSAPKSSGAVKVMMAAWVDC